MRRRRPVKHVPSDSSDDDEPLSKLTTGQPKEKKKKDDDSSSESDIESYLKPADKIDLDDPFFNMKKDGPSSFDKIESEILAGVSRLTDSESDDEPEALPSTSKVNFQRLHDYTKKLEEAKRQVEAYNARKQAKDKEIDVENLLAAGESKKVVLEGFHPSDFESGSDSEKEGWEEVKESEKVKGIPKEGLQITVELPGTMKKKKDVDLMAAIKRRINRVRKENQILVHKVHLLGWIAHGNYVSSKINSEHVLATALSLLPSQQCYPEDRTDLKYLEQILKWYRNAITNIEKSTVPDKSLDELLEGQINKKEAFNKKMLVYIFIAIMRSLGIQCRLVLSFQVELLRPPSSELHSLSTSKTKPKSTEAKPRSKSSSDVSKNETLKTNSSKPKHDSESKTKTSSRSLSTPLKNTMKKTGIPTSKARTRSGKEDKNRPKTKSRKDLSNIPQLDGANDSNKSKPNLGKLKQKQPPCPVKVHPKRLKTVTKYRDTDSEDEVPPARAPFTKSKGPNLKKLNVPKSTDVRNDIINIMKKNIKEQADTVRSRTVKKHKSKSVNDDDSDYVLEAIKKKRHDSDDELVPKIKVKKRLKVTEEDDEPVKKKRGLDVWAEVFLETEEKWISVDVVKGEIHCVKELYARASHPVSYVVAWNNNNTLKDITKRYCNNFNTVTRKLRIDSKWWESTLKSFVGRTTARDKEEDEELERQQLEKPLPTSITEYKNHPLYVLNRHLLKFEAIYPPDVPPLGFVRNEPVYSRSCVYTLHSRELWLKHAKTVKPGEEPYKIVKSRPKWDKLSSQMISDQMLEIFGPWQTQDYEPPTAENGVVPRNAFGNVELFKPSMIPKKTVHLQLPGLHKIARRMNIDCAAAVVGFDFHGGWNHPVYDGFVVCEEHADELIMAWEIDREEQVKKEREKIEKRVYGNWRKLIRGLLIRERLKIKYDFGKSPAKKKDKGAIKKRKIESEGDSD